MSHIMLIYLDLETTGLEEEDRLCALGIIVVETNTTKCYESYVKASRKVRAEAMAVHHITNEMLVDAPDFEKSEVFEVLKRYNNTETILLGHNINFDIAMLAKEGFVWQGGIIDTLKCARHLIDEIDRFSLQYLRYELRLYAKEVVEAKKLDITLRAHTALSDALHVKLLHEYLQESADDERLMELTLTPALIKKFLFGKHKNSYIEEVAMKDKSYLQWLLKQEIDEDLSYSIQHYL